MDSILLTDTAGLIGLAILVISALAMVFDLASRKASRPPTLTRRPVPLAQPFEPAPEALEVELAKDAAEPETVEVDLVVEPGLPGAEPALAVSESAQEAADAVVESQSVLTRVRQGLAKTRSNFSDGLSGLFQGRKAIDEELLEDIESQLLMADVGIDATQYIVDRLTEQLRKDELKDPERLFARLKHELQALLEPCSRHLEVKANETFVILMVGVNGAGKTTTIGKLAKYLQAQGRSVMLAAGDTFRAAAVEQLQEWGNRNDVPVVAQHTGADSASVIYDALESARARGVDVLIADTAGRLQNKDHLMAELTKIKRVMAKLDGAAPHEVMLVLDAGTGQNAISQARLFNDAVGVTGITMTKLDGTAKGGVIFAVARQMHMPIRFIGVGEKIDDLKPFDAGQFVEALFE